MPRLQFLFLFSAVIASAQDVITGVATFRERMALPPNSTFEATLEDVSRADAPAVILSRTTIPNPGNPPYSFSIPYEPLRIQVGHDYAVRARVLSDNQLMFISDGVAVLTSPQGSAAGVLLMRRTSSTQSEDREAPLGVLPATFAGTLPCADCPGIRYELNLSPDQSFTLRNTYLERSVAPLESKGRWQIQQNKLVLIPDAGSGDSFAIKSADVLRKLDTSGSEIKSNLNYDLQRVTSTDAPLKETYWRLTHLGQTAVTLAPDLKGPNLVFHTDNRITGSGGCNSLSGSYKLENDALTFGQIASTMMACASGMDTEQAMHKALGQTKSYTINGQQLDLLDGAGKSVAKLEGTALR